MRLRWNPIYDSTLVMYQKLLNLGFVYQDGQITIIVLEETPN